MKVRRMGTKRKVRLLRTRTFWVCLFTGVFAVAVASRPGARTTFAQTSQSQVNAPQAAPSAASGANAQAALNAPSGANAQSATPDQGAKRDAVDASGDARKKQIADDSVNLMKLASNLKAEVDKTNQDTLSLAVIRQAEEIEKLAHKMRTK
jgi:hypothetical protein